MVCMNPQDCDRQQDEMQAHSPFGNAAAGVVISKEKRQTAGTKGNIVKLL